MRRSELVLDIGLHVGKVSVSGYELNAIAVFVAVADEALTGGAMARKIEYWGSTAIACLALFGSLSYLSGSEQVVSGFAKAGYPQHLRTVLGIAKPVAAIVLLIPGFALLKEWAYPLALLGLVAVSYFSRPPSRRLGSRPTIDSWQEQSSG